MGEFFGSIYCALFEDFFGLDLADYMWGNATPDGSNLFIGIGLWMFGVSLLMAVLYYYVIDKPRWANIWAWLVFMLANFVLNFIIGWQWVLTDYYAGDMAAPDPVTQQMVALPIDFSDCLCFGVTNAILSLVVFFIFSLIIKWRSTNCWQVPF